MKVKQMLATLFAGVMTMCGLGCAPEKEFEFPETYSLLTDRSFSKGLIFTGYASNVPSDLNVGVETFGNPDPDPEWRLGQWACRYNLADETAFRDVSGSVAEFRDGSKKVTLDRETGEIYLELNASREYVDAEGNFKPRAENEPWPHLLLEQPFMSKNELVSRTLLGDLEHLYYTIDFEIEKLVDYQDQYEYNQNLHTAQFVIFSTLFDQVDGSSGNGSGMWFGFNFFDARYAYPPEIAHQDSGKEDKTDLFIYSPDMREVYQSNSYFDSGVTQGVRYTLQIDALPYIRTAVETAKQNGFAENIVVDNLSYSTTNFGFELTGIYDLGVRIHSLDILAVRKG